MASRRARPPPNAPQREPPDSAYTPGYPLAVVAGRLTAGCCRRDRAALLGSKPKANMETLDKALHDLVESLHPSPEELQKQQAAFQKVGPPLIC